VNQSSLGVIILLAPLVAGVIVALLNSEAVNSTTEKAEAWARAKQAGDGSGSGRFSRYVINPLLLGIVKLSDWTDSFDSRGIKNGARVAAAGYLTVAWIYLLFVLVQIIVVVAIGGVIIYVAFRVLLNSNDDVRRGYEAARRVVGPAPPGHRINPETGVIQEEGLLGWQDTDRRVNPETGRVQEKGLIGWDDTDVRIDQESGVIQEEGLVGFRDTETRINPESGVIQEEGLLGWNDTEERIDPKTGKRQKRGLIGWVDSE
jgi:hypothetical protein